MTIEAAGKDGHAGEAHRSRPPREERRAAALRDNLKRRKIQARSRADRAAEGVPADDESSADER